MEIYKSTKSGKYNKNSFKKQMNCGVLQLVSNKVQIRHKHSTLSARTIIYEATIFLFHFRTQIRIMFTFFIICYLNQDIKNSNRQTDWKYKRKISSPQKNSQFISLNNNHQNQKHDLKAEKCFYYDLCWVIIFVICSKVGYVKTIIDLFGRLPA